MNTVTVNLRERLWALLEPLLTRLGYELIELDYAPGHGRSLLRLYIDAQAGVGLDDCERVSREVTSILDVEDPIPSAYTLKWTPPDSSRRLPPRPHFGPSLASRVSVAPKEPCPGRGAYPGL